MRLLDEERKWEIEEAAESEGEEDNSDRIDLVDSSSEDEEAPEEKFSDKHKAHRKDRLALKRGREPHGDVEPKEGDSG